MADAEILQATADYIDYPAANTPVRIDRGKTARPGHPIVKRTPHMWAPIQVDYDVEEKPAAKAEARGKAK